jgi:hypothetical protein
MSSVAVPTRREFPSPSEYDERSEYKKTVRQSEIFSRGSEREADAHADCVSTRTLVQKEGDEKPRHSAAKEKRCILFEVVRTFVDLWIRER